ncbi:MAG: thioredoxin domain-containing protein [Verrucomicrobiales bacterium]
MIPHRYRNGLAAIMGGLAMASLAPAAEPESAKPARPANRLAKEKSPYLLQHAHNPVDWYPWGEEAFNKAKAENKPILLSIGYATCHWCHVMERESFMDEKIAGFLNKHFVSIKLDREERPDLDRIYMSALQAIGLGGGWPLNVFMTPERKPFFGGTYFPPTPKGGQAGFLDVIERIHGAWTEKESEIRGNADLLTSELSRVLTSATLPPDATLPGTTPLAQAVTTSLAEYDAKNGGFAKEPKFPQPAVVAAVLRHGLDTREEKAIAAAVHTLHAMAAGGIHDHLGGGFARYAVDERWLVPHFEKMLYDNAQLACAYLDASVAAPVADRPRFSKVTRGIFDYVKRDMTSPDGAFYSAEDAQSEGHEGKFYTWTKAEIESLLSPEEASFANRYFGITGAGNFEDHSHPTPLKNQNVLSIVDWRTTLSSDEAALLAKVQERLFTARAKRVRPLRDDKVLAGWNGLMLSAFARGAMVLRDEALLTTATRNATFLRSVMWDPAAKSLTHRWRDGGKDSAQVFNSYAYVLQGVIDLYQTTLDPQWLTWALELADSAVTRFYDSEHGGFFQNGSDDATVLLRLKEDYDDAEPSGNSVMVGALLRLAAITDQARWREIAEKTLKFFAPKLAENPGALPLMAQHAANAASDPFRIVIAGDPSAPDTLALLHAAWSVHAPNKVVLGTVAPVEEFARSLTPKEGKATAFVCSGKFCHLPTTDPAVVAAHLVAPPPDRALPPVPSAED